MSIELVPGSHEPVKGEVVDLQNLAGGLTTAEEEMISRAVRAAEISLAEKIERRLHELGKGLNLSYEANRDFAKRIFEGMPAHLQPGKVKPYGVELVAEQVIEQKAYREDPVTGEVDINRPNRRAGAPGDPPDITH